MKRIIKQFISFIGISGVGWLIDFTIYNFLNYGHNSVSINNMISSLVAVSFVFGFSTRKTFIKKNTEKSLKGKFVIYVIYQLGLITFASKLIQVINVGICDIACGTSFEDFSAMVAKVLVTPITMLLNFIVMKIIVERI